MSNFDFIGSFLGKRAQLKKDGHDMSNLECSSAPFGVFTPVSCIPVVPNEHYEANIGVTVQTAPMREDNFARIYQNLKAVFVPLDSICRDYLQLTQNDRSTRKDQVFNYSVFQPVFNLGRILSDIHYFYHLAKCREELAAYVPDYSSYSYSADDHTFVDAESNDIMNKIPESAVYATTLVNWLLTLTITASAPQAGWRVLNGLDYFVGLSGESLVTSTLRILDSFGFGNFIPLFESLSYRYKDLLYIIEDIKAAAGGYEVEYKSALSPADVSYVRQFRADPINQNVDIFNLFAWKYYISLCEVSNYRQASTSLISYDAFLSAYYSNSHSLSVFEYGKQLIFYPYSNSATDLQFISSSLIDSFMHDIVSYEIIDRIDRQFTLDITEVDDTDFYIYLFGSHSPLLDQDVFNTSQLSVVNGSIPTVTTTELQNNIVKAYAETSALYSLRQDLLRAGVRRDKQMQAIFGVSDKSSLYEGVQILDVNKTALNIQGLLNQSETEVAPLGDRAARGNGGSGIQFKLDSKDFGFIFIVQYFTAEMFYENFMIDRSLMLSSDQWFNPKFNHLGLEPIGSRQLSFIDKAGDNIDRDPVRNSTSIIGYSARDWHLKQRVNKVHGLFTNYAFAFENQNERSQYYAPTSLMRGNALFGGFVPTLIDQQTDLYERAQDLYFNPYMLNNLFATLPSSGLHSDQSFDFFRCAWTMNIHKVSPMPKLGLFRLDV